MKYHELKAYIAPTADGKCLADYYLKSDVDAAIDELNAEINRKEDMEKRWFKRCIRAREKALVFYFAMTESCNLNINGYSNEEKGHIRMRPARWWRITWLKVERKCRAKMEEYK